MAEQMRIHLWNNKLTSKMNVRYYHYLRRRYEKRDLFIKISLAILTSGAVASWGIWEIYQGIWKILSAGATIVAIINPFLNYSKLIGKVSDLHGKWVRIEAEYAKLWIAFEDNLIEGAQNKLNELLDEQSKVKEGESEIPYLPELIIKCQEEVMKSEGIKPK
ncbi:MAG: hypothetical protein IT392_02065 [Nitrospirae bacterium]|nr:hypothetical protein [Nitrospirota bacterium]